jgi:tRNA(Ile)-lysidine synthase
MIEQFLNHIDRHALCAKTDRILLAVSGGMDSMAMLRLFQMGGFSIGVAHVNFQLRGNESDGDESFVQEYCRKARLPFYTKRFATEDYAESHGLSKQMAARELRYDWFDELLIEEGYTCLATAHHISDSVETILLNWISGASLDGLLGIPVKHGTIIRPMLFATRSELEGFAHEQGLQWRMDSSNDSMEYRRNYIRHKVMPLLMDLNPSLEKTVMRGMEKLTADYEFLKQAFQHWKSTYVEQRGDRLIIRKEGFKQMSIPQMILWRLINHFGFTYDVCTQVMEGLNRQVGSVYHGSAYELVSDRETLIVYPKMPEWKDVTIAHEQTMAVLGPLRIEIRKEKYHQQAFPNQSGAVMLDAGTVDFPLVWRKWKPGDVFYPFGLGHRKKISDLLIDNKVSRADKMQVTVLTAGDRIVWVVGLRMDERFKVTDKTQDVLVISVSPYFD